MDLLIHSQTRDSMLLGMAKFKLGFTYVKDGGQVLIKTTKDYAIMEMPTMMLSPSVVDGENNVTQEATYAEGFFLAMRCTDRFYRKLIQRSVPAEITFRSTTNPEQVIILEG